MAKMTFNTNKALGMAGAVWGESRLMEMEFIDNLNLDPKMEAIGKIFLGDWLPKQKQAQKLIKNNDIRYGAGAALEVIGIQQAMEEFGVAGVGQTRQLRDDDILVVAIEGANDVDYEDTDTEDIADDDLDVVNEDDDLDVVNEDILAEDILADDDGDVLDDYM